MDTNVLEQQPWRILRQQPKVSALFRECQKERLREIHGRRLTGQTGPDFNRWRKSWGSCEKFQLPCESYRTCRRRQGWEPTPMDTNVLEQQPWRILRQQPKVSALFRECQKERLREIHGRRLTGQTGPDFNRWRKSWGSCEKFQLPCESYRTCRRRQGWEPTPMDTNVLEQQPWRILRQQPKVSALFRECQKERLREIHGRRLTGQTGPDFNRWRKSWGSCEKFQLPCESYRTCRRRQGWEPTPMDTNVLEQQPWRILRQQPKVSALFRECQKERLREIHGRRLTGQTGPDFNRWRKSWGSCEKFQLPCESYRTCRRRQGWEPTPMDTNVLEQQPWRILRQQPKVSALFRECQKERLREIHGRRLTGQTGPDFNRWRKSWGSCEKFQLPCESYRTCRRRQVRNKRRECN
ncbi:uncharacterized protein [Anas platyrhynchos]